MNEPTPTGASEVPPSALESLKQQFLNAAPLGVANHSYALGATFKVVVRPLLRENEKLKEKCAILQSQVDNADVNLEQVRMALKANHARATDAENQRLREALENISKNWDCDTSVAGHHSPKLCRCCQAEAALNPEGGAE